MTSSVPVVDQVRAGGSPARLAQVFAPAPISSMRIDVVVGAGFAALAAYSMGRVGGAGALNSIWGEDAANFLTDALLNKPADNIFRPVNGYFLVMPRIAAEIASLFPADWMAGALSLLAVVCATAMAILVYLASAQVLPNRWARGLAAAGILISPLAESMFAAGPNEVAVLQFVALYAVFWCAFWTPQRRGAKTMLVLFLLLCSLSSILTLLLVPLILVRLWVRRDRLSWAMLSALVTGALVQILGLVAGVSSRGDISHPRLSPLWALKNTVTWALPFGMLGPNGVAQPGMVNPLVQTGGGAGPWYWVSVLASLLVVLGAVAFAVLKFTRPNWTFAVLAVTTATWLTCAQIMIQGELALRYVYAPWLIVAAALISLVLPRDRAYGWVPLAVLSLLLGLFAVMNYRLDTMRSRTTPWTEIVAAGRADCSAHPGQATAWVPLIPGSGWGVTLPCRRLSQQLAFRP